MAAIKNVSVIFPLLQQNIWHQLKQGEKASGWFSLTILEVSAVTRVLCSMAIILGQHAQYTIKGHVAGQISLTHGFLIFPSKTP